MKYFNKFLVILFLTSCTSGSRTTDADLTTGMVTINLELESLTQISIDSLLSNPRFVPLETNKECVIDKYDDIVIRDSIIFILSNSGKQHAIFAFNLEGRFLFKLDAQGRGPGEYLGITAFSPNTGEEYLEIAAIDIMRYRYDGTHIGNMLNLMEYGTFVDYLHFNGMTYAFAEGMAIQFMSTGKETNAFKVFDKEWNLIQEGFPIDMGITSSPFDIRSKCFFTDSEKAFFSHPISDTIYEINGQSLNPAYLLNFGENGLPYDEKHRLLTLPVNSLGEYQKFFLENKKVVIGPENLGFTDSIIYLNISYGYKDALRDVFYNRTSGNAVVLTSRRLFGPMYPKTIFCSENMFFGIVDAKRIHDISSGKYRTTPEADHSPFSLTFFPELKKVLPEDNMVLVFFDINSF